MKTNEAHETFRQIGFSDFVDVSGVKSIHHIVNTESKCGIYCLLVDDCLYYIGQSVNIATRFSDHRRRYQNIIQFSFVLCSEDKLDELEEYYIQTADAAGIKILNVQYASHPICKTDFDELVPANEKIEWLNNEIEYSDEQRKPESVENESIRVKGLNKYQKLLTDPNHDFFVDVCAAYTFNMIPSPFKTEHNYWGVSCLPSTARYERGYQTIFCFNIYRIETFVMLHRERTNEAWAYIVVAKSILIEEFGSEEAFLSAYPDCEFTGSTYQNAGYDHITIGFLDLSKIYDRLSDWKIMRAARVLNLRLMGKGRNFYKQYHSFQLADKIFEQIEEWGETSGEAE